MTQNFNDAVLVKSRATGRSQRILVWMAAVITSGFIGCGGGSGEVAPPPLGLVKGKITVNGTPAAGLVVTFQPQGKVGALSQGATNASGEYELIYTGKTPNPKGAAVGEHVVQIFSVATDAPDEQGNVAAAIMIPERYNSASELKASVAAGENPSKDFDLQLPK